MKNLFITMIVLLSCFLILSCEKDDNNDHSKWVQTNSYSTSCFAESGMYLFAGTNTGVFRSTNNGSSWTPVNTGLSNNRILSLLANGTNIFAGTIDGIFLSTDYGTSWVSYGFTGHHVFFLMMNGAYLYASVGSGPGVNYTTDNGITWTEINSGLTAQDGVVNLVVSGQSIFAGTEGGGVFLTSNNGTSWTAVNNGLTNTNITCLAVSGSNLFAGTKYGGGIFLSADNGTSWTTVNNGLTNPLGDVNTLFVNGTNIFTGTNGVYFTTNSGANWTEFDSPGAVYSFVVSGAYLLAGTNDGIWRCPLSDILSGIE